MIISVNGLVEGPNRERGVAGAGKDEVAQRLVKKHGFVAVALADPMKRFCQDVYEFSDEQLWGPSGKRNEPDARYLHRRAGALGSSYLGGMNLTGTVYEKHAHLVVDGHLPSPPEDEYLTPRHALQQLGTDWGRACFEHTWVDYLLRVHAKLQSGDFYYDRFTGLRHMLCADSGMVVAKTNMVVPDVRFYNEAVRLQQAGAKIVRVKRICATLPGYFAGHLSETELLSAPDSYFDYIIQNDDTLEELYRKVDTMMEELPRV